MRSHHGGMCQEKKGIHIAQLLVYSRFLTSRTSYLRTCVLKLLFSVLILVSIFLPKKKYFIKFGGLKALSLSYLVPASVIL